MKDPTALAALKLLTRLLVALDLRLRRALGRLRERPHWVLTGRCAGCGRCCEEPSIQVAAFVWRAPRTRALFLWWQRHVNGFEQVAKDPETRTFAFRCLHFDPGSRLCDSYRSRPAMCRDYPRLLLDQAWPDLFPGCGFRVRARAPGPLLTGIEGSALSAEQKARLKRSLRLE